MGPLSEAGRLGSWKDFGAFVTFVCFMFSFIFGFSAALCLSIYTYLNLSGINMFFVLFQGFLSRALSD